MPTGNTETRNPGPAWGFRFIRFLDRFLPGALFRPILAAGTWIAVLVMRRQRTYSREYLGLVLGRAPTAADVHKQFMAVSEALVLRLRVADGMAHRCVTEPGAEDFDQWLASPRPILLGSFHIGDSDLTGFMLAGQGRRPVRLVRLRVGNSYDTEALASRFGSLLRFVWVNDPGELLIALKEAGASEDSMALQCDRAEHSSRTESFDFLGARRTFPFTIYHLSLIFNRPVLLSFAAPAAVGTSTVYASPAFVPVEGESRAAALVKARAHFQGFLRRVETYLRANPYQWLNFRPL